MNRIKELREAKGVQQKEMAIVLGVSQPTVSDWESGRKVPSAKSTMKLSKYFSVSVEYLLGEDNTLPPVEYETLMRLPGMKILFDSAKNATEDDRIKAAHIIEVLRSGNKSD